MTTATMGKKCLVLNRNWTPVATVSIQRAITMLFSEYDDGTPKAKIIDHETFQIFSWSDWSKMRPSLTDEQIAGANYSYKIPEIILLSKYEKMPRPKVHFSRRTLFKRDKMMCQYCGEKPGTDLLTIDHVIPRAQGGTTTWENCALCCVGCNRKKADKTPKQAGMKLLSVPAKPSTNLFRYETLKPVKSWEAILGEQYWNTELDNENVD
jgi:5-methylcytosine-specific restriction endonuclease McrA